MDSNAVCAVIVAYHPAPVVLENLAALRPQVEHMVVVDNGSPAAELAMLRAAAGSIGFELIENGANLGIAQALNAGVKQAQKLHYGWVLLFDQDSQVTEGFRASMAACFEANNREGKLAILNPRYRDSRTQSFIPPPATVTGGLEQCTTSGSLMPMSIFEKAGWFDESLFIDGVDYEYSLRVRTMGYVIRECGDAVLLHAPGSPTLHTWRGKRFQVANYGPVRRYYQERNKVLLLKRYGSRFLPFFLRQFVVTAKDLVKIVLIEDDKRRKLTFIFRGMFHGLIGRDGEMSRGGRKTGLAAAKVS